MKDNSLREKRFELSTVRIPLRGNRITAVQTEFSSSSFQYTLGTHIGRRTQPQWAAIKNNRIPVAQRGEQEGGTV